MTIRLPLVIFAACCAFPAFAQAPVPVPAAPSTLLRPALDTVVNTVNGIKTDRWKRGTVRDEAVQDVGSILTDIQVHLPPLLSDADAAPTLVSKQVPIARNIDALYDVLLRVFDAARIAGSGDQVDSLQQALNVLSKARLALYDRMSQDSGAQEKLVVDLRATMQKQSTVRPAAPPAPAPCPVPTPKKKKSTKPSPSTPATTQKSGQ